MPSINVSLKDGGNKEELEKMKKSVEEQGGSITRTFKVISGFTAEFPDDKVHTLQSNEHVDVEENGQVHTQ